MQKSFNSGEWAPALYSRVDLEKYRSGAALLLNWFVDYRGGASTRSGTEYILQAYKSATAVRIIPFQAAFLTNYILEFGQFYIRFYNNGAPVLETALNISGATQANPAVLTVTGHNYNVGDWVFVTGVLGMTQLNGNYYSISATTTNTITLADLNGNAINSTGYGAYVSGGTTARVYTLPSPFAAADLALVKYAQSVNTLILTHPSYPAQVLTLIAFNNWTIQPIVYGSMATTPGGVSVATTLSSGTVNYAYEVTSVDSLGEESSASSAAALSSKTDLRTVAGTNTITWTAAPGAVSYNVYKSTVSYAGAIPAGIPFGFAGNTTSTSFIDSNISPDYSQTPPIATNPFQGGGVASVAVTTPGTYTTVPTVTFTGGSPTINAAGYATLSVQGTTVNSVVENAAIPPVGSTLTFVDGVVLTTGAIVGGGPHFTCTITNPGSLSSGSTPSNPLYNTGGTNSSSHGAIPANDFAFNFTWGVSSVVITAAGAGYTSAPTVAFSAGSAAATATLASTTTNPPAVPGFFQQRLVLAGGNFSPETLNFSQPGAFYNYNVSNPIQSDDAISSTLASGQLETIKSMIPTAAGLIVFTDKSSWLINGGSLGSAISPATIVANRQSFNGANDMPPILNNFDILYVESKGSAVRDSTYNFYANVFTGADISLLSSHLFFGYQLTQWAFAQEPFSLVWAVRNDGVLLSLTFKKEEEFVAWAHHNTQGSFESVASVTEQITTPGGTVTNVDAVYVVVQRTINGNTVQYIERMADRYLNGAVKNAWCVDAGIQYNGSPATTFSGAQQLAGAQVTGLADGVVIPPFTMPLTGTFTLGTPASLVTVGLAFTPQLQTLPIDMESEQTIQGKQKKISGVVARCVDTLGLSIGSSFSTLVAMQDLIQGNVGSMTNQIVTDLVTGDAMTYIDPLWATQGQFCLQQSQPLPATVTGVIPQLTVGDTRR